MSKIKGVDTIQGPLEVSTGELTLPGQPSVLAYVSSDILNVTGDATAYNIVFDTEVFDQGSDFDTGTGVFTAPVTGRYLVHAAVSMIGLLSAHTDALFKFITSNRTYTPQRLNAWALANPSGGASLAASVIADMDASDTLSVQLDVRNGTKVVDVQGSTNLFTYLAISLKD